jgi:hypothetical protein
MMIVAHPLSLTLRHRTVAIDIKDPDGDWDVDETQDGGGFFCYAYVLAGRGDRSTHACVHGMSGSSEEKLMNAI